MRNNSQMDASLALYLFGNKVKKGLLKCFTMILIAGLCFTILYPILDLVQVVFSSVEELGNPNVIWIPLEQSTVSFKAATRFIMPEGVLTMIKSVLCVTLTFYNASLRVEVAYMVYFVLALPLIDNRSKIRRLNQ